jgi:hypothetical protein
LEELIVTNDFAKDKGDDCSLAALEKILPATNAPGIAVNKLTKSLLSIKPTMKIITLM